MQHSLFDISDGVRPIKAWEASPFLLDIHYAGRIPSISYAFGLYRGGDLVGVCTYGSPSSAPLRTGICGAQWADSVVELNRLCLLDNIKNDASYLVAHSLKMLPKPSIVISFADTEQGHIGYVYQATNFIYCGLSEKRTDWKIKGAEHLHGQSIADKFKGKGRAERMRQLHGDDFYLEDRPRKHRYVYFVGSKSQKKAMARALNYGIKEYPKTQ